MASPRLQGLFTRRALALVWGPVLAVASLHYLTPTQSHWVHDIARRLYYVPIVFGGGLAGVRGGLVTAAVAVAVYAPHAFWLHLSHDPGSHIEKLLEVGFYVLLGVASGLISERMAAETQQQTSLADDLKRTLDEVQLKDAQLERAARLQSLGELTAGLAHEIRNPLHAMRGAAQIVLDAVPPDSEERQIGARWIVEIDRLSGVLTRLLSFAKGAPSRTERVLVSDVLDNVFALVEAEARRQGTAFVRPPRDERAVCADRDPVVQVVLGLCINGLQALGGGGALGLRVETARQGERERHALCVWNDGPPIADADAERIFDPFFSTKDEGTGLGLSVAWRIITSHGGTLDLEGQTSNGGPCFRVWLPAWEPSPSTDHNTQESS